MAIFFRIVFFLFFFNSSYSSPQFLTISDVHYGSQNTIGDGNDTGDESLFIIMNKFKQLSKKVDFILTLGDLPTHLLGYSPDKEGYERTVFHGFYEANINRKPMFYVSGNNDSLAGNYQPFEQGGKSPLNTATDWNGACMHCEGLMINNTHMLSGGYYSTFAIPNNKDIMLIVLNTTQWKNHSIFLPRYPHQEHDALKQLAWLKEQMRTHHAKQLLIAMHIPPGACHVGGDLWHNAYQKQFFKILRAYQHQYGEISLITSHTHMDEFRKLQIDTNKAIYAYSTPAISRIHHNNPGIKLFNFNSEYKIKNFTTHYSSSIHTWEEEHYKALGTKDSIFPQCREHLAACLNKLKDEQIYSAMEQGLFYGVKSAKVDNVMFRKLYHVANV